MSTQSTPMNSNSATPESRIRFLDALRGIAVLCIFIANIAYFSGLFFISPKEQLPWAVLPSDHWLDFILFTLIDGKFYTIFSLLFGIGCAIQFHTMQKNDLPFKPFFRRRMFWLVVIGGIHLCLIWLGDILTLYAILGFVLLNFIHTQNKNLIRYAVILIMLPILNDIVIHGLGWDYPAFFKHLNTVTAKQLGTPFRSASTMGGYLQNTDWPTYFKTNLSNTFIRIMRILNEGRPFKVLGIFLIGLWSGRKIIHENLLGNVAFLKKVAIWGICIGLPLSTFRTYIEFFRDGQDGWDFIKTIAYAFGTVPLGLGMAALLALQYQKNPGFLRIFEPVGKMALTNYISQTLVSIALFYGIGFGLAGKFGFTIVLGIALLIYTLQIIISTIWLRNFRQGPIEWFWRYATKRNKYKTNKLDC
jgi:uncharacterized protein